MTKAIEVLLLAEDFNDVTLVKDTLEMSDAMHFELTHVSRARDLMKTLEHSKYHVLLIDTNEQAIDVAKFVHERHLDLPIVVLSKTTDDFLSATAAEIQTGGFIVEGYLDRRILVRTIRYAIEHVHLNNAVSDLSEFQEKIKTRDILTGLINPVIFEDRINRAGLSRSRNTLNSALLYFDLDNFQAVNQEYGTEAGDMVLKQLAKRLQDSVRPQDSLTRLFADKYALFLQNIGDELSIARVVQRLQALTMMPFVADSNTLMLTASIGISMQHEESISVESWLEEARNAMYRVKQKGGNDFTLIESSKTKMVKERMSLEMDINRAWRQGEFKLYFQPLVDTKLGRTIGFEALIRWQHPTQGLISPAEFLELVDDTGMIIPLGDWVLRQSCQQIRTWQAEGLPPVNIAINISTTQYKQTNFVSRLQDIITQSQLDPHWITLEFHEKSVMLDPVYSAQVLHSLKDMGISVSIDDYGSENSTIGLLRNLPVDTLKIDHKFLNDFSVNMNDAGLVKAVITVGHCLQKNVIACGVETLEQQQFLADHGCLQMQGHFFCKPLPAEECESLLSKNWLMSTGWADCLNYGGLPSVE